MAGKIRHMVNRSGRYHARLVVPKKLRAIIGKTELRQPLGGDYREAMKQLHGAVAQLQHKIALAELKIAGTTPGKRAARYPLAPDEIALANYRERMALDDSLRSDHRYASIGIDDRLVRELREGIAGRLTDERLEALVGERIERYRHLGNTDVVTGTEEWRAVARALCVSEYEALARAAERDEGDYNGAPAHPALANAKLPDEDKKPVSIKKLWEDYVSSRTQAGFMKDGGKRQAPVIKSLRSFLKHDNARKVARKDLLAWRDGLMTSLSAKTVNDIYLSTVRSLFNWAHENERLDENPAATVRQAKPRKVSGREKGYTDDEALAVLSASINYEPKPNQFGYVRETPKHTAAKRWAPIICAFTGARISEITQLRKEDVRQEGDRWIIRITPDAGTVKAGDYRDVPLHRQIVELGFIDYMNAADPGPLFHNATGPEKFATAASSVSDEISKWLRRSKIAPEGVQPNHAWRHRFKTKGRELGIDARVLDAIQGHAARTAGDGYGDVTLAAKTGAVDRLSSVSMESAVGLD